MVYLLTFLFFETSSKRFRRAALTTRGKIHAPTFCDGSVLKLQPKKDTSLAMIRAAVASGHEVSVTEKTDFKLTPTEVCTHAKKVETPGDLKQLPTLAKASVHNLAYFDTVIMRCDPPVDTAYVTVLQALVFAASKGVRVVNHPDKLLHFNEKLLALSFPTLCPPTLVSAKKQIYWLF